MAAAQKVNANWLEKDSEFCPMDGCPQERLEGSINSNGLICQATEGSPGVRRWRVLQFGWARPGKRQAQPDTENGVLQDLVEAEKFISPPIRGGVGKGRDVALNLPKFQKQQELASTGNLWG